MIKFVQVKERKEQRRKYGYTSISNYIFKETKLSLKAKGLFVLVMSLHPKKWKFSIKGLATRSKDGEDSIRAALKELEEHGFLIVDRTPVKGRFNAIYTFYERPLQSDSLVTEEPMRKKPRLGKSKRENPAQLNTNEVNTNELSTNVGKPKLKNNPSIGQDGLIGSSSSKGTPSKGKKLKPPKPKEVVHSTRHEDLIAEIRAQIGYDDFINDAQALANKYDRESGCQTARAILVVRTAQTELDYIVNVIADVLLQKSNATRVNGRNMPTSIVQDVFRKVNSVHVQSVRARLGTEISSQERSRPTNIKNLNLYLITALYNEVENPKP
ncbi:MAG: helix-turn-helix domain-containing protein [Oscillospiraceae bacterium]|nr:helix-turn-helix domain-containing protein [Oscillospiraceae bacterium]